MGCGQSTAAAAAVETSPPRNTTKSKHCDDGEKRFGFDGGRWMDAKHWDALSSHDSSKHLTLPFSIALLSLALTAGSNSTKGPTEGTASAHQQQNPTTSTVPTRGESAATPDASQRRADFAVRPGYSSGASSYDGSMNEEEEDEFEKSLNVSRHNEVLALDALRQEMVADGDLTKTVVRIEVRECTFWGAKYRVDFDGVHSLMSSTVSCSPRMVSRLKKSTMASPMDKSWDLASPELFDCAHIKLQRWNMLSRFWS